MFEQSAVNQPQIVQSVSNTPVKCNLLITLDEALFFNQKILGPVVQSVVSLTSSLRVIPLTVLADSIYNILIFFAEKM